MPKAMIFQGPYVRTDEAKLRQKANNIGDPRWIFYRAMLNANSYEEYYQEVGGKTVEPETYRTGPVSAEVEMRYVRNQLGWISDRSPSHSFSAADQRRIAIASAPRPLAHVPPTGDGVNSDSGVSLPWHLAFAKVLACEKCNRLSDPNLLRDGGENVPQPGYIGTRYEKTRLLLIGQNPAVPAQNVQIQDKDYTAALRAMRDQPTLAQFIHLRGVLDRFIPSWQVHGQYFPLYECGLSLEEIAYFNLVRCRTSGNAQPNEATVTACYHTHFEAWLNMLRPRGVVFIGLWAGRRGEAACSVRGIPSIAVDRNRSLSSVERRSNRAAVEAFIFKYIKSKS